MQLRWRSTKKSPAAQAPGWIRLTAGYPFIFLVPASLMFYLAWFFWQRIASVESGQSSSVYLGELKFANDLFGKWGVSGFFIFIGLCTLYLFWYYAMSES
jgi:hypothetical protein